MHYFIYYVTIILWPLNFNLVGSIGGMGTLSTTSTMRTAAVLLWPASSLLPWQPRFY